jgi:hypothetical protein
MFNLRGPQGQNPRTTCGPRTTVFGNAGLYCEQQLYTVLYIQIATACRLCELAVLPSDRQTDSAVTQYGAVRSVGWIFIVVAPDWRCLGKYVTLGGTFYGLHLKQEAVAATVTVTVTVNYCHSYCQLLSQLLPQLLSVTATVTGSFCHSYCQLLPQLLSVTDTVNSVTATVTVSYCHSYCKLLTQLLQLLTRLLSVTATVFVSYCHSSYRIPRGFL